MWKIQQCDNTLYAILEKGEALALINNCVLEFSDVPENYGQEIFLFGILSARFCSDPHSCWHGRTIL